MQTGVLYYWHRNGQFPGSEAEIYKTESFVSFNTIFRDLNSNFGKEIVD